MDIEDSLKKENRRRDEFIAMLAHELRNLLAPILNAAQIMGQQGQNAPVDHSGPELIERQVRHLVRLIDDLLDISRILCNKIKLKKERFEISSLIKRAVETAQPLIESCSHTLHVQPLSEPVYIEADLTRLVQVFSNLLNNAAKYTPKNGHIWLSVEKEEKQIVLRVRDSGVGIPKPMLSHIFEMFTQIMPSPTLLHSQGGLGIGLALAKNLVELHGGSIEAQSPGALLGSEFVIRLPLDAQRKRKWAPTRPPSDEIMPVSIPPSRILVVDDIADVGESLAMLLRMKGHEVQLAYCGTKAIEMASEYKPEMVILDIGMPGMDGYVVARKIRELPHMRQALIIALTGFGKEEDRKRADKAGFNYHLTKPTDVYMLEKLLVRFRAHRDEANQGKP